MREFAVPGGGNPRRRIFRACRVLVDRKIGVSGCRCRRLAIGSGSGSSDSSFAALVSVIAISGQVRFLTTVTVETRRSCIQDSSGHCKLVLPIAPVDLVDSFGRYLQCVLDAGWFTSIASAQWSASSAGVRLRLHPSPSALQPKDQRTLRCVHLTGDDRHIPTLQLVTRRPEGTSPRHAPCAWSPTPLATAQSSRSPSDRPM